MENFFFCEVLIQPNSGQCSRFIISKSCFSLKMISIIDFFLRILRNNYKCERVVLGNKKLDVNQTYIKAGANASNISSNIENFIIFFFLSGLSFTDTANSQDSRGREGTFFSSTLSLPPPHEHSDIYVQLSTRDDYHIFLAS